MVRNAASSTSGARIAPVPPTLPELARVADLGEGDAVGLAAKLSARPDAAASLVGEALVHAATAFERSQKLTSTPRARLALVVDQLEELFTHDLVPARRQAFISVLAVLARSGRAWVLATLRSDFYSRLEEIPELIDLARGHEYVRFSYAGTGADMAEACDLLRSPE